MGIADLIPGISGGTIALITNIYKELIDTIKSFNVNSIYLLINFEFKKLYNSYNLKFLFPLLGGIFCSIFLFVSFILSAYENFPIHVFSLFFGLVIFSSISILFTLKKKSELSFLLFLFFFIGIFIGLFITTLKPISLSNDFFSIFFSGMISICAMILPGLSGSFILLILGKYFYIIEAVKNLDIPILLIFATGALVGLFSFSRIISFFLKKYYDNSLFFLVGLMLGSSNKLWPWKVENTNVSPFFYNEFLNESSYLISSIIIFIISGIIILIFEKKKLKLND